MRKDLLVLLLVLIPAALLMLFVVRNQSIVSKTNQFSAITPFPTISIPTNQISSQIAITPSSSQNIEVLSPFMGEAIKSGFVVKGNARTFENSVVIRLLDSDENILIETFTTAKAPDIGSFGPFEKVLNYQTKDSEGKLEVFQYSAKDGSEIDKVEIPVLFTE